VEKPGLQVRQDRQEQPGLRATRVLPDHKETRDRQELQVRLDHPLQARLVQLERRARRERQVLLDLKAQRATPELQDRQAQLVRQVAQELLGLLELLDQQVQ
jgi:hypothetical protein